MRETFLEIDSVDLKPLDDPEEFYDHDLIGLDVVTVGGEPVGAVKDVLHHGQNLLVVTGSGARAGTDVLIPFVTPIVPEVDLVSRRLVIDPPPGLLDPDAAL